MSDELTPRTDAALIDNADFSDWGTGKSPYVNANFARELERELAEEKRKLNQILYDVNYEGGLQYWIRKHDALMFAMLGGGLDESASPETKQRAG